MKYSQFVPAVLIAIGLALRFEVQFLEPFFNNDEIDLGNNINQRGFIELLLPLKHYQTAPPLFLWIMKCVYLVPFGAAWIKYKSFFFLLNVAFLYLVYDLVKQFTEVRLLRYTALAIVCFNPFFIYHGLTLKQYLLDAVIALLLVKSRFSLSAPKPYRLLWVTAPLLSNPVLFIYAAYLIRYALNTLKAQTGTLINKVKSTFTHVLTEARLRWFWLPLLLYVVYFVWYQKQDGYLSLTRFMWDFWRLTFFSNSHDFFIRIYYFFIGNVTFIFSHDKTLAHLGTLLLFIGLYRVLKRDASSEARKIVSIYGGALLVFVVLNFLKMYPIAPRLLLFFSPMVVVLIVLSGEIKHAVYRVLWYVLIIVGLGNYALYFPFKENDVIAMTKRLDTFESKHVFYSMNSVRAIRKFDAFTEHVFAVEKNYVIQNSPETRVNDSLFVLKLVHQFGRDGENGPIMEPCIPRARQEGRMELISVADGFNIYKIKDSSLIKEFIKEGILHPDYAVTGRYPTRLNPF